MKKILFGLILTVNTYAGYWQCYAEDSYRNTFWGTGTTKYQASSNALVACQYDSVYPFSCRVTSWCDWKY